MQSLIQTLRKNLLPLITALYLLLNLTFLLIPGVISGMLDLYTDRSEITSFVVWIFCLVTVAIVFLTSLKNPVWTQLSVISALTSVPRLVVLAFLFLIIASLLRWGYAVSNTVNPFFVIPFFLGILVFSLTILNLSNPQGTRHVIFNTFSDGAAIRRAILISVTFVILVLIRDFASVFLFSIRLEADASSYINEGSLLFVHNAAEGSFRSYLYTILTGVLNTTANPYPLIVFQSLLAAIAISWLVYVLVRRDQFLGITAGIFLLLDIVWLANTRTILTESISTSLIVIMIGLLIHHYDQHKHLSGLQLAIAGLLFGIVLTFRSSNILLFPVIIIYYLLIVRVKWRILYIATGISMIIGLTLAARAYQFNQLALVDYSGRAFIYPMFNYQLFDPQNGEASQRLSTILAECGYPNPKQLPESLTSVDRLYLREYGPCARAALGSLSAGWNIFTQAYIESIRSDPIRFALVQIRENSVAFAANMHLDNSVATDMFGAEGPNTRNCTTYAWCESVRDQRLGGGVMRFPVASVAYLHQPYLLFAPYVDYQPFVSGDFDFVSITAWLLFIGVLLTYIRGRSLLIVLICFTLVHYIILSTIGSASFFNRYLYPSLPAQSLLAAMLILLCLNLVRNGLRQLNLMKPNTHPNAASTS